MDPSLLNQPVPDSDGVSRYQRTAMGLIGQYAGETFQLRVVSDSMAPTLHPGYLIEVETCQGKTLHRGDIVVRLEADPATGQKEDWIVHRLVGKSTQGWLTKGDAMHAFDPYISSEFILGRVIQIHNQDRRIDLQRFPWKWVNRYLGFHNYCLGCLFTHLRRLRGRVKSGRGANE